MRPPGLSSATKGKTSSVGSQEESLAPFVAQFETYNHNERRRIAHDQKQALIKNQMDLLLLELNPVLIDFLSATRKAEIVGKIRALQVEYMAPLDAQNPNPADEADYTPSEAGTSTGNVTPPLLLGPRVMAPRRGGRRA